MGNDVSRICSNIFFKQIFFANLKSVCVISFFEKNLWRIILRWLRMTKVEDVKFFCDLGKEIHLKIFTHIRSDSGFRYDSHMIHNYFPRCIYRARHFNVMNRYLTAQKKKRFFFFQIFPWTLFSEWEAEDDALDRLPDAATGSCQLLAADDGELYALPHPGKVYRCAHTYIYLERKRRVSTPCSKPCCSVKDKRYENMFKALRKDRIKLKEWGCPSSLLAKKKTLYTQFAMS